MKFWTAEGAKWRIVTGTVAIIVALNALSALGFFPVDFARTAPESS